MNSDEILIVGGGKTRKQYAPKGQKHIGGRVKTPNINNKKLVVRSCVDVQRVFVFLQ